VDHAQVIHAKLKQIEGVEEDRLVVVSVSNKIETRAPVSATSDRLAIDHARLTSKPRQALDDQREPVGQVVARTAIEPHLRAVLAGDDPETIMLDFMQPQRTAGRCGGLDGEARRDETQHSDFLKALACGESNFSVVSARRPAPRVGQK
jgi:hypothetical protein